MNKKRKSLYDRLGSKLAYRVLVLIFIAQIISFLIISLIIGAMFIFGGWEVEGGRRPMSPLWSSIIGSVVAVIIGFVFTSIISKKFLKPIDDLKIATDKVAKGDFSTHVDFSQSEGEIAELINNFNFMTSELKRNEMLKNDFELLVNTGMIANDSCVYEYNLGVQNISWGSPIATCICGEILGKTVSETWREIKNAGWKICVSNPLPTRIYLDIKITACKGELTIDRIKHMLDGIISSLHHYTNFTQQEELFLTQLLNCSSQELTSKTILDERKFVSIKPSNSNLKWNPADDREVLKGCRIYLEDGTKKKTEITVFS